MTDTTVSVDVRTFWMNVALGLKNELILRGNRIEELERELARLQGKCLCDCRACAYCEQSLEPEPTNDHL